MDDQAGIAKRAKDAPSSAASSQSRPLEIEEPLNRHLVHPAARALATLLIPTGISPNAVSALSVVMMALACACYALLPWPGGAFAGLVFQFLWHVFDGADGDLARRTGKSSPTGEIVDGVCDHLSHLILYLTLGVLLAQQVGPWGWALTVVSAASRAFQAACYETARRTYRRWVYGVNWIRQDLPQAEAEAEAEAPGTGWFGVWLAGIYIGASAWVRADDSRIEALLAEILPQGGAKAAQARALCQTQMRPLVKRASWLSTNWETLGVFLTILAGSPLWFLAFQASAINLVMVAVVLGQKRSYGALAVQLEALAKG